MDGIIDNLTNAIQTWNEKMAEIWLLLTQSPQEFKGGVIWEVIQNIHGALQSIGIALLVLFFVFGIVKTLTNMNEIKRPEQEKSCPGLFHDSWRFHLHSGAAGSRQVAEEEIPCIENHMAVGNGSRRSYRL